MNKNFAKPIEAGIIKLYLPLMFNDRSLESSSYTTEVFGLAANFAEGSNVYLLSPNDVSKKMVLNDVNFYDFWSEPLSSSNLLDLDYIFIFNSKPNCTKEESKEVQRLYFAEVEKYKKLLVSIKKYRKTVKAATKFIYVVTDLDCVDDFFMRECDYVISQSYKSVGKKYVPIETTYTTLNELKMLTNWKKRQYVFTYVGNERPKRVEKLSSMAKTLTDAIDFFGKFDINSDCRKFSRVHPPTTHEEGLKIQEQTKYTYICSDTTYEQNGHLTPRYLEALQNNTIAFIDVAYDEYCVMLQRLPNYNTKIGKLTRDMHVWRRCRNSGEAFQKMLDIERDATLRNRVLRAQRLEYTFLKNTCRERVISHLNKAIVGGRKK